MTEPNESAMRRIQALLERAGHPETPEHERDACQEKADKLMQQHRIERAMLNFTRKDVPKEIMSKDIDRASGEYSNQLRQMQYAILKHAGCQAAVNWEVMTAVGYEEDIFFAEMLWAQVRLDFTSKMFPRWETWRSFDANVYEIKSAGYSWVQVCSMGMEHNAKDVTGVLTMKNGGSKLRTAFKREAKRRGVVVLPGKQQPMKPQLWRDSFASSYRNTLENRLWALAEKNRGPREHALALQTDADRVLAEFYRLFPKLHPDYIAEEARKAREAHEAWLAGMTPKERREWERDQRAWEKIATKKRYADPNAWQKGHEAASNVNVSRGNAVGDPDRKGLE